MCVGLVIGGGWVWVGGGGFGRWRWVPLPHPPPPLMAVVGAWAGEGAQYLMRQLERCDGMYWIMDGQV